MPGGLIISYQTVRNRLRDAEIRARRPVKVVVLTQRHHRNKLQWAQTQQRWRTVWFSDESRFLPQRTDGSARVHTHRKECFATNYIQQVDIFGGGNVMMWTAISYTGRINIVQVQDILTAQRYCDEQYQYFSYIVAVSFIGGGNRSTRRKPATYHKLLKNFII
jgi:hypothetical protein